MDFNKSYFERENSIDKNEENNTGPEQSGPIDFSEIIEDKVLVSDIPFNEIIGAIETQFTDYINIEDKTDYVDVFYNAYHKTLENIETDESESHKDDYKEALDKLHKTFVDTMANLFSTKLTIFSPVFEDNSYDENDEILIKDLYDFFILGAKNNFKIVIAKYVLSKIPKDNYDDNTFYNLVKEKIMECDPLLPMGAQEFLKMIDSSNIQDLYLENKVNGNFLRKYSAKLYKNEEFVVDIVSYITTLFQFEQEVVKNG